MKAVVQRVQRAKVTVEGETVGEIGVGLLVLAAAHSEDTENNAVKLADRVLGLRIFNDEAGKMNLALAGLPTELTAGVLAISNFTVYGETAKSRRPSFTDAAHYDRGKELFDGFVSCLRSRWPNVQEGVFGADMKVELLNDGPVTVIVET